MSSLQCPINGLMRPFQITLV